MSNYNSTHSGAEHDLYTTKSELINLIYPVGSIYISVSSTSPATLFGGTWEQITGKFLLGSSDTYTIGSTGGEATHTLTIDEMPSHWHDQNEWVYGSDNGKITYTNDWLIPTSSRGVVGPFGVMRDRGWANGDNYAVQATGGSQAHNNMPPYLAVYIWKRIS